VGVHLKAAVPNSGTLEEYLRQLRNHYDETDDLLDICIFILGKLLDSEDINDFEYLIAFSYFVTDLVHKTIAQRIIIDDGNNVRYMSKQNVHQHITGKIVSKIIEYAKINMPAEYRLYFANRHKRGQHAKES
jgi:hypothetical protein